MSLTGQIGPVLDEISYKLKLLDHLQTNVCFPVALINHQYLIKQLIHVGLLLLIFTTLLSALQGLFAHRYLEI